MTKSWVASPIVERTLAVVDDVGFDELFICELCVVTAELRDGHPIDVLHAGRRRDLQRLMKRANLDALALQICGGDPAACVVDRSAARPDPTDGARVDSPLPSAGEGRSQSSSASGPMDSHVHSRTRPESYRHSRATVAQSHTAGAKVHSHCAE